MKFAFLVISVARAFILTSVSAESVPSRYIGAYPTAASKKGLQVEIVEDALALGVKHAALNFNLSQLIDPQGGTNNPTWERDGRKYHFQRGYLEAMDKRIKTLSDRSVIVNLIVLTYQSGDPEVNTILIHPRCVTNAPNRLGNFNTVTDEGRRWLAATLEFCAERWSRTDQKRSNGSTALTLSSCTGTWTTRTKADCSSACAAISRRMTSSSRERRSTTASGRPTHRNGKRFLNLLCRSSDFEAGMMASVEHNLFLGFDVRRVLFQP